MTRTAHLGLGPIGEAVLGVVLEKGLATPLGIVDIDVERVRGRAQAHPWGDLAVASSLEELPLRGGDVVVQCTGSRLASVVDQLDAALRLGACVISTCEELSYPWLDDAELAHSLDQRAKAVNAVVLASGVNPGLMMDALPMFMSVVTRRLDSIRVTRVVDAARRRGPLQSKVGAGLSREDYDELAGAGKMGHVGLRQSVAMLAAATGLAVDRVTTTLEPVMAQHPVQTETTSVSAGAVAGIHQVAIAWSDGAPLVTLDLSMYVGAPAELDQIDIIGDPEITLTTSGVQGDVATATVIANLIGEVAQLKPGLRTMIDLVPVRAHAAPSAASR